VIDRQADPQHEGGVERDRQRRPRENRPRGPDGTRSLASAVPAAAAPGAQSSARISSQRPACVNTVKYVQPPRERE
jgi:hypothetical protein